MMAESKQVGDYKTILWRYSVLKIKKILKRGCISSMLIFHFWMGAKRN